MGWQLAEAKNKLSEVVRLAISEGPQEIARRNDKVYLVSERDYLCFTQQGRPDFKNFLLHSAPDFTGLDLTRSKSPMRESVL